MAKIGLLVIATGKYDIFIPPLVESVNEYFMKNHDVTIFVFTDKELLTEKNRIFKIKHKHLGWPDVTLKRYHVFNKNAEILSKMDYLFYCDADMLFIGDVGDEILPAENEELVGTMHPGFYDKPRSVYPYETNTNSLACINANEGNIYFAGGFNGGTSDGFLKLSKELKERIDKDLENDIIAIWHDESHLNRYLIDNKPKVLNSSYCCPKEYKIPFEKKILALDKNHKEIRN